MQKVELLQDMAAEFEERAQRLLRQLRAPMMRGSSDLVCLVGSTESLRALAAVEDLVATWPQKQLRGWEGKHGVAAMYAAGTGAIGRARMPSAALGIVAEKHPGVLKPLAASCADGYITAMQHAPLMVFRPAPVAPVYAGLLPLIHARMVQATEFKIQTPASLFSSETVKNMEVYDEAACKYEVCFTGVRTLRSNVLPSLPSLAEYMPNLQRVDVTCSSNPASDDDAPCFMRSLLSLKQLKVLRIRSASAVTPLSWEDASECVPSLLSRMQGLEHLELGVQLSDAPLPAGLKQLAGQHGGAMRLMLWPDMVRGLRGLEQARLCTLCLHSDQQPTAQQLEVLRAMDASCALRVVHRGKKVAIMQPAASTTAPTAVTTAYVAVESASAAGNLAGMLDMVSRMLPQLKDLWVLAEWDPTHTWSVLHKALRAGIAKPARLHTSSKHGMHSGTYAELRLWCEQNGVQVEQSTLSVV